MTMTIPDQLREIGATTMSHAIKDRLDTLADELEHPRTFRARQARMGGYPDGIEELQGEAWQTVLHIAVGTTINVVNLDRLIDLLNQGVGAVSPDRHDGPRGSEPLTEGEIDAVLDGTKSISLPEALAIIRELREENALFRSCMDRARDAWLDTESADADVWPDGEESLAWYAARFVAVSEPSPAPDHCGELRNEIKGLESQRDELQRRLDNSIRTGQLAREALQSERDAMTPPVGTCPRCLCPVATGDDWATVSEEGGVDLCWGDCDVSDGPSRIELAKALMAVPVRVVGRTTKSYETDPTGAWLDRIAAIQALLGNRPQDPLGHPPEDRSGPDPRP